jgi:TM2 domain-containing membrane protein YozV
MVVAFRFPLSVGVYLVLLLAAMVCVCSVAPAWAFQEGNKGSESCVNPTIPAELGFADALFAEGDYYRAVTEYKRFVYLYPEHSEVVRARLNMARGAIAAERWGDARSILQHTLEQDQKKEMRAQAHVLLAEIPYLQGKFNASFDYLERVETPHLYPAFAQRLKELQLWSLLEGERLQQAHRFLQAQEVELCPDLEDLLELQELPRKSPRLAGTLSALLPGAGQLYNGRYREAGMAFALNAAFVFGGLQAIDTGNTVLGGILLFFEAGWYGGNIYNAVNTAHKTNRRRYRSKLEQLREGCRFSLLSAERGTMLQLSTRF